MGKHFFEYRASIDLLDLGRAWVKTVDPRYLNLTDIWKIENIVNRWKWVVDVELGHLNYAILHFETNRADVAERRMKETLDKLDRLIKRLEKKAERMKNES